MRFDLSLQNDLSQVFFSITCWFMNYPGINPSKITKYGKSKFPRIMDSFLKINKRSH